MGNVLTPSLAIRRHYKLTKLRELPIKGVLSVKVGDRVEPDTIIGRAELPGFLSVLRVCEALECAPEIVAKELKAHGHVVGNLIKTGDLVAQVSGIFGMFKRQFFSTVTGVIEYIAENSGHIGVRGAPEGVTLSAFVKGEVLSIEAGKSALIQVEGAYVQGAFGVGGERRGKLLGLTLSPDQIICSAHIPDECSGTVLFGGAGLTMDALTLAAKRGAVGIVTGAISDQVLREYLGHEIGVAVTGDEAVPLSVIVTEGFGSISMSQAVLDVLRSCSGLSAGISGVTQVRAGAVRPEIICERPGKEEVLKTPVLEVGSRVRLIRVPYFGQFGEIIQLPHELQVLPTGASARVAEVKLDSGEKVRIPRANIEIQL
jgi:hypothetical protein